MTSTKEILDWAAGVGAALDDPPEGKGVEGCHGHKKHSTRGVEEEEKGIGRWHHGKWKKEHTRGMEEEKKERVCTHRGCHCHESCRGLTSDNKSCGCGQCAARGRTLESLENVSAEAWVEGFRKHMKEVAGLTDDDFCSCDDAPKTETALEEETPRGGGAEVEKQLMKAFFGGMNLNDDDE